MPFYTFRNKRTGKFTTIGGADNSAEALKTFTPYTSSVELIAEQPLAEPPYNDAQLSFIEGLRRDIENSDIQMAVVDYLGRTDSEGRITDRVSLNRRFGTRSRAHVDSYKLKVVWWNHAGIKALNLDDEIDILLGRVV